MWWGSCCWYPNTQYDNVRFHVNIKQHMSLSTTQLCWLDNPREGAERDPLPRASLMQVLVIQTRSATDDYDFSIHQTGIRQSQAVSRLSRMLKQRVLFPAVLSKTFQMEMSSAESQSFFRACTLSLSYDPSKSYKFAITCCTLEQQPVSLLPGQKSLLQATLCSQDRNEIK